MGVARVVIVGLSLIVAAFPAAIFAAPLRVDPKEIESEIGAKAYIVIDRSTGTVLTMKQENRVWPIASLTKLVTADVVLEHQVSKAKTADVKKTDDVGGARLSVSNGDTFSVNDLFYATLVASANNAANALSRTTGLAKTDFVSEMNAHAAALGLTKTHFVDPTGIDPRNVSTVTEMARLADTILAREEVRRYTTTATRYIEVLNKGVTKKMTNTNWMLYKPAYDDVWVTGGKTGYLEESGWNVVVTLQPSKQDKERELLLVVFGATSRNDLFIDAERLADWAWETHAWQKEN